MDGPTNSPSQENEVAQQPSELPIVCEKDHSQGDFDHVPSLVSDMTRLPMLLLTIASLSLATGSRNKTYSTLVIEPFQPILRC